MAFILFLLLLLNWRRSERVKKRALDILIEFKFDRFDSITPDIFFRAAD